MRRKKWFVALLCAVVGITAAACGGNSDDPSTKEAENTQEQTQQSERETEEGKAEEVELHILAAASMTDVLTEIADKYEEEHPEITLTFSFDSSGTLQTQIEEGAPADVFISAALKQMNELNEQGLMDEDSIIELLENKVVLIKPKGSELDIASFEDVASDKVTMAAIGNSDVPVGQYTQTIYENLGLWDQIQEKANYATNVRQVLDWVATKNADCGIVYATDAAIEPEVEIISEAPEGSCTPAIYPAGIVKDSEYPEQAKEFMDFLKTDEVKEIFENYQFTYIYSE